MKLKIFLLYFFIISGLFTQDFWKLYKQGFQELYTNKNVSRAEQIFYNLTQTYPEQWLPFFQLGIIHKNFYKNPSMASALFY
ncbi:MAG: hypothetical protein KatS3mg129_1039 [Leptospiraceae bacterium]|nr:MAG: hypothetical protein KatS3mg129_1039 [Leptospiraceae bacterium]